MPITGYDNDVVNTLRIWDAEPIVDFELDSFDKGDYKKAVEQENLARNIVEVLYPNDNHYAGKELRLKQQYFFVSASLQEAIAKYKKKHDDIHKLYEKVTCPLPPSIRIRSGKIEKLSNSSFPSWVKRLVNTSSILA